MIIGVALDRILKNIRSVVDLNVTDPMVRESMFLKCLVSIGTWSPQVIAHELDPIIKSNPKMVSQYSSWARQCIYDIITARNLQPKAHYTIPQMRDVFYHAIVSMSRDDRLRNNKSIDSNRRYECWFWHVRSVLYAHLRPILEQQISQSPQDDIMAVVEQLEVELNSQIDCLPIRIRRMI